MPKCQNKTEKRKTIACLGCKIFKFCFKIKFSQMEKIKVFFAKCTTMILNFSKTHKYQTEKQTSEKSIIKIALGDKKYKCI